MLDTITYQYMSVSIWSQKEYMHRLLSPLSDNRFSHRNSLFDIPYAPHQLGIPIPLQVTINICEITILRDMELHAYVKAGATHHRVALGKS